MMPPQHVKPLSDLFEDIFTPDALERFLVAQVPWGRTVARRVALRGAIETVAFDVVEALRRHGHIDTALFDALAAEFPSRSDDIRDVARQLGVQVQPPNRPPQPQPRSPERPPPKPWFEGPTLAWERSETRKALDILVAAYPTLSGMTFVAATAGIPKTALVTSGSSVDVWRGLLDYAAGAAKLELLLARVLEDANVAGFHASLRATFPGAEPRTES